MHQALRWAFMLMVAVLCTAGGPVEAPMIYDSEDVVSMSPETLEAINFRRRPIMSAWWAETPAVRVCASSGVTPARMERALDYWRRLGYELDRVWYDDGSELCRGPGARGEITIAIVNTDVPIGNNLAVTQNFHNRHTGEMIRSRIWVFPHTAEKQWLLEHELGHALGWAHYNRYLHIMNADYPDVGHDSTGLTYREWQAEKARLIERLSEE